MSFGESTRTAARRTRSAAASLPSAIPATGITIYECEQDEAELFLELGPRLGVMPEITAAAPSEATIGLVAGNRCISIGHKTRIANSTLVALRRAGVTYISTRSIGYNHLDLEYANGLGILVENVDYSPDSVADYTLMLMLMALRNAKTVVQRTAAHDYRLSDVRGSELRDLTVGVVGTGRIGAAVIDRLGGFGCRVLAHDIRPTGSAEYIELDELLSRSDIVTLHTPLDAGTHYLLDGRRIQQMKLGAVVVNTARGSLIDTRALLVALNSGRLGGAALDVLEGEEGTFYADCRGKRIDNDALLRLQAMSNVVISPHTAYYTEHALRDTVENTIRNCLDHVGRDHDGHA
jgi:D-specific alpha-keto acid dehydrogenase